MRSAVRPSIEAETVWLVGMMGAGKSAVGRALAERLGRSFVDTDVEIERSMGLRVSDVFASEGEASFRAREREWIEKIAGEPAVVALGGGAIAQRGIPLRLAEAGTVVYLRARPERLLARLGERADRPLLAGLDRDGRLARLRELLEERRSSYETASIVVDTDRRAVAAVVSDVAERLEEASR